MTNKLADVWAFVLVSSLEASIFLCLRGEYGRAWREHTDANWTEK